jgi:predicted GNAT superfamily acetyltransferase
VLVGGAHAVEEILVAAIGHFAETVCMEGGELISISTPQQCEQLARVLADVWGFYESSAVASADTLLAMAKSGCYVTGVLLGGRMIGGGFGWPHRVVAGDEMSGGFDEWRLHSHVIGFLDGFRALGLGAQVKLHQREFAREAGLDAVEWTYDPLHAANARFNLAKLGARVLSFHYDYYGTMDDAFSGGLGSDRFLVRWGFDDEPLPLAGVDVLTGGRPREPILRVGSDGAPVVLTTDAPTVYAELPVNIVNIRKRDKQLATQWRDAFAETVGREVTAGARVVGIGPELAYHIDR